MVAGNAEKNITLDTDPSLLVKESEGIQNIRLKEKRRVVISKGQWEG